MSEQSKDFQDGVKAGITAAEEKIIEKIKSSLTIEIVKDWNWGYGGETRHYTIIKLMFEGQILSEGYIND